VVLTAVILLTGCKKDGGGGLVPTVPASGSGSTSPGTDGTSTDGSGGSSAGGSGSSGGGSSSPTPGPVAPDTSGYVNLSFASTAQFQAGQAYYLKTSKLGSGKFVSVYMQSGQSSRMYGVVSSVSGHTISWGTPGILNSDTGTFDFSVAGLDASWFVAAFSDPGDGAKGKVKLCAVGVGLTAICGMESIFNAGNTSNISVIALASDKFMLSYVDENGYARAVAGSVNAGEMSLGSAA